MILAIRISGLVEIPKAVNESLFRFRLRKKYTAVLVKPTENNMRDRVINLFIYDECLRV
mgnify:CR=1 FL=1